MNTLQERMKRAVQNSPHIPAEVARLAKISRSAVSGWMNGSIKTINGEHCVVVADVLGVSYAWLAAGVGPMKATSARTTSVLAYLTAEQANDHKVSIDMLFRNNAIDALTLAMPGLEVSQYDFAYRLPDASMEPQFIRGDTLVMSPEKKPSPGDLVLASINNEAPFLRRYRPRVMQGNNVATYELTPVHTDFAAITIGPEDSCKIIAVATSHIQNL